MSGSPFHDTPEFIDADLPDRCDAGSRFLTTGFAFGDEILIGLSSKRQNEKETGKSKGRSFHDRTFQARYQEIDSPIALALRFGAATSWLVQWKRQSRFHARNTHPFRADYTPRNLSMREVTPIHEAWMKRRKYLRF
ncbi:hypothetical protein MHY87_06645 [Microvirga sp. ACRRW]|uniref:hypothetical protein n=1 Tax=Microvirga sp. ACRRW TaxID=2918205 RepID=UPI001EF62A8C|nr:hypothetical protein [Microvirga sp. ACRRW]MCG7392581.1 hypothetical protein [Microvirga sp. ACRRW]